MMSCLLTPDQSTTYICQDITGLLYSLRIIWLVQREYILDLLNIIDTYCMDVVRSKLRQDIASLQ